MCVAINYFIGFTQYQLFIQSSERGLFETSYFTTNIYNALQLILVFPFANRPFLTLATLIVTSDAGSVVTSLTCDPDDL